MEDVYAEAECWKAQQEIFQTACFEFCEAWVPEYNPVQRTKTMNEQVPRLFSWQQICNEQNNIYAQVDEFRDFVESFKF